MTSATADASGTLQISAAETANDASGNLAATINATGVTASDPSGESWELDVVAAPAGSTCAASASQEDEALDFPQEAGVFAYVSGAFTQSFYLDTDKKSAVSYTLCGYLSCGTEDGETSGTATANLTLTPPPSSTKTTTTGTTTTPATTTKSPASPTKPRTQKSDKVKSYGASSKRPAYFPLYVFSAACTAVPCTVKVTEKTLLRGKKDSALGAHTFSATLRRTSAYAISYRAQHSTRHAWMRQSISMAPSSCSSKLL